MTCATEGALVVRSLPVHHDVTLDVRLLAGLDVMPDVRARQGHVLSHVIRNLRHHAVGTEVTRAIDDARELAGSPEARSDQIMHGRGVLCSRSEL
jgi:hypothetical protein